jgi:hypothetical protein
MGMTTASNQARKEDAADREQVRQRGRRGKVRQCMTYRKSGKRGHGRH